MKRLAILFAALVLPFSLFASEADLKIPDLTSSQNHLLMFGFVIILLGMLFGYYQFTKVRKLKAHKSMLDSSDYF